MPGRPRWRRRHNPGKVQSAALLESEGRRVRLRSVAHARLKSLVQRLRSPAAGVAGALRMKVSASISRAFSGPVFTVMSSGLRCYSGYLVSESESLSKTCHSPRTAAALAAQIRSLLCEQAICEGLHASARSSGNLQAMDDCDCRQRRERTGALGGSGHCGIAAGNRLTSAPRRVLLARAPRFGHSPQAGREP